MYIWKLARVNVVSPTTDTLRSVVVIAATDSQARVLASSQAGDEGRNVWTDDQWSACVAIGEANTGVCDYPGVVCADYLEA